MPALALGGPTLRMQALCWPHAWLPPSDEPECFACTAVSPETPLVELARVCFLQGNLTGDTVSGYAVRRWTVDVGYQSMSGEFVGGLVEWLDGVGVKAAVEFDACR